MKKMMNVFLDSTRSLNQATAAFARVWKDRTTISDFVRSDEQGPIRLVWKFDISRWLEIDSEIREGRIRVRQMIGEKPFVLPVRLDANNVLMFRDGEESFGPADIQMLKGTALGETLSRILYQIGVERVALQSEQGNHLEQVVARPSGVEDSAAASHVAQTDVAADSPPEDKSERRATLQTRIEQIFAEGKYLLDLSTFLMPSLRPAPLRQDIEQEILGISQPILLRELLAGHEGELPVALNELTLKIAATRSRQASGWRYTFTVGVAGVIDRTTVSPTDRVWVGFVCGDYSSGFRSVDIRNRQTTPISILADDQEMPTLICRVEYAQRT